MVNRSTSQISNSSSTVNNSSGSNGCTSFTPSFAPMQQPAPLTCDPQIMASNYSGSRFYSNNQHGGFYAAAVVPTTSNGYSSAAAASFGRQSHNQQDVSPRGVYQASNSSSNAPPPMHSHYQKGGNAGAGLIGYRRFTSHHQQQSNPSMDLNGGGRRSTMSSIGYNDDDKFTSMTAGGNYRNEAMLSDTNLYIRGLSADTTDDQLREMCEPYGKIVSTKAIIDKSTNQCKGYGFVDFDTAEAARSAVKSLAEKNIQAQMAKQQEQDPTNLYIANLPCSYTEEMLEELLNGEGMVISTRILRNSDGSSRCVGFARMHSKECCDSIISKFHGSCLDEEGTQPLVVKLADSSRKSKRSISSGVYSDNSTGNRMDLASAGLAAEISANPFVYAHDYAQQQQHQQPGALFSMPDAGNRQLSYVSFGGAGGQPQYHFLAGGAAAQSPYALANQAYSPAAYDPTQMAALASQMQHGLSLDNNGGGDPSLINQSTNSNSAVVGVGQQNQQSMHAYSIGPYQYFATPNPYLAAAYPLNMQGMESHLISSAVQQPGPTYISTGMPEMSTNTSGGNTETAYCYDSVPTPNRGPYKPSFTPLQPASHLMHASPPVSNFPPLPVPPSMMAAAAGGGSPYPALVARIPPNNVQPPPPQPPQPSSAPNDNSSPGDGSASAGQIPSSPQEEQKQKSEGQEGESKTGDSQKSSNSASPADTKKESSSPSRISGGGSG